jgi:hypothetical protein
MYARETWKNINTKEYPAYFYKADNNCPNEFGNDFEPWHPSTNMPREAARIFLRVTDVKVQRIDDLTEQDAAEDGFEAIHSVLGDGKFEDVLEDDLSAIECFSQFWLETYGPNARWMWAYYFERITKEEAGGAEHGEIR